MTEEKPEKTYPIRSLHDFLSELDREWGKFRNGTLIGIISSSVLLVVVLRFLLAIRHLGLVDGIFLIFAAVFLVYSLYAMVAQYRFFNKWERRVGLLLHLEEELLSEKVEEKVS